MNSTEVLKTVRDRCPNTCSDDDLLSYLNEFEDVVQRQIMSKETSQFVPRITKDNMNSELQLDRPFDALYVYYVCMMVSAAQGEIENANNWLAIYNSKAVDAQNYYIGKVNRYQDLKLTNYF